jgi:hypothetical protein
MSLDSSPIHILKGLRTTSEGKIASKLIFSNVILSFNANANLMTNSTNPLAANYNQALISNPSNFTNYAQQPAMYAQNQLQIAQASAQALQANVSNLQKLYH